MSSQKATKQATTAKSPNEASRTVSEVEITPTIVASPVPTTPVTSASGRDDDLSHRQQKLVWEKHTEELLANWGDIASCYKWLHEQAFRKYYRINYYMSIPIIILSTITGTVSVGMSSLLPAQYVDLGQKVVGGVNIITGIITTLQNFFRFAQMSESHQHSSVGWSKLERNIRIELKVDRKYRKEADNFLKIIRSEYDRLLEQSPVIPKDIIKKFKRKFGSEEFKNVEKPDVIGNLMRTEISTPPQEDPIDLTDLTETLNTTRPTQTQEDILSEIKEMLAESRLVHVGAKDTQLPFPAPRHNNSSTTWRKMSNGTNATTPTTANVILATDQPESLLLQPHHPSILRPRKSFLGDPPPPIKLNQNAPNIRELIAKFTPPTFPLASSVALPTSVSALGTKVMVTNQTNNDTNNETSNEVKQGVDDKIEIVVESLSSAVEATTKEAKAVEASNVQDTVLNVMIPVAQEALSTVQTVSEDQVKPKEPSKSLSNNLKEPSVHSRVRKPDDDEGKAPNEEGSKVAPIMDIADLM